MVRKLRSKKKTSSEVQEYIRQRYEDTALAIYREQHANRQSEISGKESVPKVRHAFEEIAEVGEPSGGHDLQSHPVPSLPRGLPKNNAYVQSQICVII